MRSRSRGPGRGRAAARRDHAAHARRARLHRCRGARRAGRDRRGGSVLGEGHVRDAEAAGAASWSRPARPMRSPPLWRPQRCPPFPVPRPRPKPSGSPNGGFRCRSSFPPKPRAGVATLKAGRARCRICGSARPAASMCSAPRPISGSPRSSASALLGRPRGCARRESLRPDHGARARQPRARSGPPA